MKHLHLLTILYILLLLAIIVLVDNGNYNYLFKIVYQIPYGDKVGHLLLIGLLSLVVNLSLRTRQIKLLGRLVLQGSLIVFLIITFEEFTQLFILTRTFDLGDLCCDYLGILAGGQLAWYYFKGRFRVDNF